MDIIRLVNDENIKVKDIPVQETGSLTPEITNHLAGNNKVYGGIFKDHSIKFKRNDNFNFVPDNQKSPETHDDIKSNVTRGNNNGGGGGMSELEKRVESLEYSNRKMGEQLTEIKQSLFIINSKLDNSVSKLDLMELQNTITHSITDAVKSLPSENDVKVLFDETVTNKNLVTETKVENIVMNSNKGLIKWIIGTGIAAVGATCAIIRLFL